MLKKDYDKAYRLANRESRQAYNRRWRKNNPSKVACHNLTNYTKYHASKVQKALARSRARRAYVAALKRGPCVDCGRSYHPAAMDFDHVRGVKVECIAGLIASCVTEARIDAEIAKCELVCSNCHRVRTFNRSNERG